MSAVDIVFGSFFLTFVGGIWVVAFFLFDSAVLRGYFTKKLQKRFNVENI